MAVIEKVMEHIEGGSLVVNQGDEAKPRPTSEDPDERELNAVEGLAEGWKLAHVSLLLLSYHPRVQH